MPDGETGELAIRGPSLFSGYWGNDAANREAFRGGWFHMGDAFRRNPDGTLDFVDRVKYMIKSGGENIYPAEIERHILADPRIADAAVVRKKDARWGEVPVVFAARTDEALTGDEVIGDVPGEDRQLQAAQGGAFRGDGGTAAEHVGEDTAACDRGAVGVGLIGCQQIAWLVVHIPPSWWATSTCSGHRHALPPPTAQRPARNLQIYALTWMPGYNRPDLHVRQVVRIRDI